MPGGSSGVVGARHPKVRRHGATPSGGAVRYAVRTWAARSDLREYAPRKLAVEGGRQSAPGRREELQRDPVRVGERQAGSVVRVHNAAVLDTKPVESRLPLLELGAIGTGEGDVVQAGTELV